MGQLLKFSASLSLDGAQFSTCFFQRRHLQVAHDIHDGGRHLEIVSRRGQLGPDGSRQPAVGGGFRRLKKSLQ